MECSGLRWELLAQNQPQLARLRFTSSSRVGFLGSSVCPRVHQAQCPVFLLDRVDLGVQEGEELWVCKGGRES